MLSFENDYNVGAQPALLRRLTETNLEPQSGYGEDAYCRAAAEKLRAAFGCPKAEIRFLVGGTQTNQIAIAGLLKSWEGVLAAETGHVASHEAGAIEHSGHKVLTLPSHEGRIEADELRAWIERFYADEAHEHMVFPGMVYVSQPTEYGTLYSRAQLEAIAAVCREKKILLYLDGARLGYALMSRENDLTAADIARLCDLFYVGGTKVGALCGEALIFPRGGMPEHFTAVVKQHGGLLAKGRLLGLQFDALFTDGLYFAIAKNAVDKAEKLRALLKEKGYAFFLETPTNQQFVLLEDAVYARLREKVRVCFWEKPDETHTVVRFCTSWATTDEQLAELAKLL